MALLAELTHRCPLRCGYCSNPLHLHSAGEELPTLRWHDVLEQAAALGVLHVHFSGGEPMARPDLGTLIAHAARCGLYTNLITSGVQLNAAALNALIAAGIQHIQLSFQDADVAHAERISGMRGAHGLKLRAAKLIRDSGVPLTLNFVVHRQNVMRLPAMLALAEQLGAARVEIAHAQYYGWGLLNRDALLPSRAAIAQADADVADACARNLGRMKIDYVAADYHATIPKACMGGWARRFMIVTPAGDVLPCHAAQSIPDLAFPSVRTHGLREIWQDDPAFRRFRGTDWMPQMCQGCDRKEQDWGGCRCQALALTGDASRADPVCALSPDHATIQQQIAGASLADDSFVYRHMRRGGSARVARAAAHDSVAHEVVDQHQ